MRCRNQNPRLAAILLTLLTVILIVLWGCGDAPPAPEDQVGSIAVTGLLPDTTLADYISICLDDVDLGIFDNPHTLDNVIAGLHKLEVMTWDTIAPDDIDQYYKLDYITVQPEQVTVAEFTLSQEGPFVGNPALDFALYDLDSNLVSLDSIDEKIAILYFFSSG